eukprot:TRINITY_DN4944_c0_g1_i1.p1 TRINITY_DN4944_c0_g1~~TRINITY_DN4944_c0_g1_i1.p1  ORF type:complete len:232 (-),score=14.79 TRINITY_DN4944_c0_g1_i1:34-633(-)
MADISPAQPMKVAVAVDGSDNSLDALRASLRLFGQSMSEIHIIHARKPVNEFGTDSLFSWREWFQRMETREHTHTKELLDRCAKMVAEDARARGRDLPAEIKEVELKGEPRDVISSYVKQVAPDTLVMGSRGMGVLKRMAVGSVSTYCLHHAACPVLIIPKGSEPHNEPSVAATPVEAAKGAKESVESPAQETPTAVGA